MGRTTGGRHCPLLHWCSGGCLCHRTQPSGCLSLSNKQCGSARLPPCLRPAECSLSGLCCWPSHPLSHVQLPSLARLACSVSHSLSLAVTLCLLFSSPFVSRTCPCSPSQAPFLSSLPSSSRLLVSLLSPVRSRQPPPQSPSAYKPCLIASSLGKKIKIKKCRGWGYVSRFRGTPQPWPGAERWEGQPKTPSLFLKLVLGPPGVVVSGCKIFCLLGPSAQLLLMSAWWGARFGPSGGWEEPECVYAWVGGCDGRSQATPSPSLFP